MRRYVIVPVDDDQVKLVDVYLTAGVEARSPAEARTEMANWRLSAKRLCLSAPPNNRLTLDLEEAIATLEMSGWPYREQVAARLRAAFGLNEEE